MVRFLSEAAVVWMHEYLIRSYGGSRGIRDQKMKAIYYPLLYILSPQRPVEIMRLLQLLHISYHQG